jgi:plastocyanin
LPLIGQNALMHIPKPASRFALPAAALLALGLVLAACGGDAGAGWTYAPLGPTADPNASPTAGPSTAASPGASNGAGTTIDIVTTEADPLGFEPAEPEMPAATEVTVNYLNDSSLLHNIEFFAGADTSSEMLGATEQVTGPGALESVTFTTPADPGDYYFWCRVHGAAMQGIYHVQ